MQGVGLKELFGPIALGIAAGLAIGKPLGVFGAASAVMGLKLARRPTGVKWVELLGLSCPICLGIRGGLLVDLVRAHVCLESELVRRREAPVLPHESFDRCRLMLGHVTTSQLQID